MPNATPLTPPRRHRSPTLRVAGASASTFTTRALDRVRLWQPTTTVATLAIVGTGFAYAFTAFFARRLTDAGLSPVSVAVARFAVIAVVLARFVRVDPPRRTATIWGLASGAAMGVGWIAYVDAIEHGTVALAGLVYMTYPVFTLLVVWLVFGGVPTVRHGLGAAMVVTGAAVALGFGGGSIPVSAVIAPATFGFSIAVLTERLGVLDPFERLGAVALGATASLTPVLATVPGDRVLPASPSGWLWVGLLGIACALVPMLVYAAAAPRLGAGRSAVAGSAELPTVFAIGALFFGEAVTLDHLLGAAIIAAAIAVTPSTRATHVLPDEDAGEPVGQAGSSSSSSGTERC